MNARTLLPVAALLVASFAVADVPAVQEWSVDAGTTGMLVEDHRVPLVTVRLAFPAGTWSPWGRAHHVEEAFESQLRDTPGELRRRADQLAVHVSLGVQDRSSSLWLTARREDLAAALALVKDVLANRDIERDYLKRLQQERKLGWSGALKEPQFVLGQAATRLLVRPGDPRGRRFEKPDAVETDPAKLADARDALIRLPGRLIGFAGDLTLDEARRAADGLLPALGAAPPDLAPVFGPLTPAAERPRDKTVTMPKLTQAYFAYGRDSLCYRDADWPASEIADHVLGGHFNSRLMVALRQEGGETYGAGVQDFGGLERSAYGMGTFTRSANAGAVEEKLRTVLKTFHEQGITEQERADAASYLVGQRAFARQSPGQILGTRMWERASGLPDGFSDGMAERASKLTLEEINAFIKRFYDPAQFTMLKVM